MTAPFNYPAFPHERRHGPRGYANHESYRPWLRDEFAFRCVYCLTRELWGLFKGVYALDHFLAVIARPDLALVYDNLLYACVSCNLSKGSQQTPNQGRQSSATETVDSCHEADRFWRAGESVGIRTPRATVVRPHPRHRG
jgi:5-methylcytosine-specific restriction endonuclease McrA